MVSIVYSAAHMSPTSAHATRNASAAPVVIPEVNNTRTTLVVRLGLIALALVGIISVFGEPLLGIGAASPDLAGSPGAADPSGGPGAPAPSAR
jgi:hypothetical protein